MYMGRVNGINLYKHGITRTYLNLDDEGNCYTVTGSGCYSLVDFEFEYVVRCRLTGFPFGSTFPSHFIVRCASSGAHE
jgi:hypothetical protein